MTKSTDNRTGRERLAEARAAEARAARNKKVGLIAAIAVAVAAVGGGVAWLATSGQDEPVNAAGADGAKVIDSPVKGVYTWKNLGREHVAGDPKFAMTPPAGGDHNAAWANCGIYDKELPNKYAVHSLEHGAVWITTNDKASAGDVSALKKLANQDFILMSKYKSQASPITLTAWGHQLRVDKASDPRVAQFIKAYKQGPQTPEAGAACTGAYDPNTGAIGGTH
ncbi:DUF3105 domain-containing protein [Yimella sp. cx-573]|nr:DUF3105 domain-containing protein [Yimella sp. cx-573]